MAAPMNRFLLFSLLPGILLGLSCASDERTPGTSNVRARVFYVSTNGNDTWSGMRASANGRKTDGPFATLARVLEAVREARTNSGAKSQPVTVFVRDGIYFLNQPVVLKPSDSDLTIAAYRAEKPILSGGRQISGWKAVELQGRSLWTAELPKMAEKNWQFFELWVNGQRAVRARHPNTGYLKVAELPDATPEWGQGQMRFRFNAG